jgi:hypothetical protein
MRVPMSRLHHAHHRASYSSMLWPRTTRSIPSAGVWPRNVLRGRVGRGAARAGARDTLTFTVDRDGHVELASVFPGELGADGSIATDRIPYRVMLGGFEAVVARWAPGRTRGRRSKRRRPQLVRAVRRRGRATR